MTERLKKYLTEEGYTDLRDVPNKGVCGIKQMLFTYGLCYGMDALGYDGRYCYGTLEEAQIALKYWEGEGHPLGEYKAHKQFQWTK